MRITIAFVFFLFSQATAYAEDMPGSFADLVEELSPAVVNISTTQKVTTAGRQLFFGFPFEQMPDSPEMEPFRDFFDQFKQFQSPENNDPMEQEVHALGSGFIIDAKGYVVTNNHVIDDAEEITVILHDKTQYNATLVGLDPKTDLALLKIEGDRPFPYLKFGNSDEVRVGDWVIAIGNPYGLGGSVTAGIISARQRSINAGPFDDFLQTDASINRGNSGGPLFNRDGEVIGVNTAIFSPTGGNIGIGFAIPVALAKPVLDQLKEFGRTHRGWLGVKIQEVTDEIAESIGLGKPRGALVAEISKDSPAAGADLKVGDIILSYNDKQLTEMRFLPRMVAETKIGSRVMLKVWRNGRTETVPVTIGELDENEPPTHPAMKDNNTTQKSPEGTKLLGLQVTPVNQTMRSRFKLEDGTKGLVILDIERSSEAAKRGLRRGDVIAQVNNNEANTPDIMEKEINAAKKDNRDYVLLRILRRGEALFVTLPVGE